MENEVTASGLTALMCHVNVSLMKQTSIRELKHETSKVLAVVESGTSLEVCRRGKPVAVLSPPGRRMKQERPDFAARLKVIYGEQVLPTTGTNLINENRGER